MLAISVRPARPEEQGDLSRLAVRATRHIGYDDVFIDRAIASLVIPFPMITSGNVLVAELSEGTVCGVIAVFAAPGLAHLHGIFVDPPHWRKGVGRRLFDAAAEHLRDKNSGAILINAEPSAVPFYERMGAVRIGESPFYPSPDLVLPILLYLIPPRSDETAPL